MLHVDDQPETLHIYVVREEAPKPQFFPIFLSVLALASLVALAVVVPYQQLVTRAVIRVPAVLLPPRTFTAKVVIIPTGVKIYPATVAHGWLTFSNGSVIGQSVPQGFTVGGAITDRAMYVPPASADGLGMSTVPAHLLTSGTNKSTLSINEVIGSSLFVRNLSPFTGGKAAYSIKYTTAQDKLAALVKARDQLMILAAGLRYPCLESSRDMVLTWRCQFVTFSLPAYMRISSIRITGKNLLIAVTFTPHLVRVGMK